MAFLTFTDLCLRVGTEFSLPFLMRFLSDLLWKIDVIYKEFLYAFRHPFFAIIIATRQTRNSNTNPGLPNCIVTNFMAKQIKPCEFMVPNYSSAHRKLPKTMMRTKRTRRKKTRLISLKNIPKALQTLRRVGVCLWLRVLLWGFCFFNTTFSLHLIHSLSCLNLIFTQLTFNSAVFAHLAVLNQKFLSSPYRQNPRSLTQAPKTVIKELQT